MKYSSLLNYTVYNNTIQDWLLFLAIFLFATLLLMVFKKSVLAKLKVLASKTETDLDDFLIELFEKRVYLYFYFLALIFSSKYLHLSESTSHVINVAARVALSLLIISVISDSVAHMVKEYLFKNKTNNVQQKQFNGIVVIAQAIIWAFGAILVLDNLGVKIGALMTGMGIGGVAVALAAQTVLKDVFSYFAILFDKPYEVGDFVVANDYMGTIEYIGLKTTRIRSLSGEEIICPNSDLVESRLRNYKSMRRRRVVFNVGITKDTPQEKAAQMTGLLESTVKGVPGVTLDRSHFASYGDFSLIYETVYYVESPDYNIYMDKQQEINLKIMDALAARGIKLAYPTQTLLVDKN
ncbi:MAG: mechanosensitive ion channel family protein [Elusimicrobia bacterium]|nr:mechanosensitive ion channel family protein [Elusimicrobiota bacterium]